MVNIYGCFFARRYTEEVVFFLHEGARRSHEGTRSLLFLLLHEGTRRRHEVLCSLLFLLLHKGTRRSHEDMRSLLFFLLHEGTRRIFSLLLEEILLYSTI